jgi:hypothetical protein
MVPDMALTPQALVEIVARDLQLPISTVRNSDRRLMEAGLRTKKGHGRGSAIMTPVDAATLLIALAASDEISRVADCGIRARELPIWGAAGEGSVSTDLKGSRAKDKTVIQLARIMGCKSAALTTFGSTIDAVMRYLAQNPVQEYLFKFSVDSERGSPLTAELNVTHATSDDLSIVEFCKETADRFMTDALRVTRSVPGKVLSHIASEIGFGGKPGEEH